MAAPPFGGAPQPAAISDAVQNLVDAIRDFGRMPTQSRGASEDERALAKRYSYLKKSIPNDILQELQALRGAPQPVDQRSANTVQNLVHAIREFGRIPNRHQGASQEERNLAKRWSDHKHSIPANVLEELEALGGPRSGFTRRQELFGQELIDAVKTLGFFPKATRPKGDKGKEEFLLAKKIQRHPFTPAQRIELNELKRTSVHPRVKMHRAHPFSQG